MRTARLLGLSDDGRSLIVVTDAGEQIAIVADARLRAAIRGDRPRLGQLEIEMESALRPREIQTRIRAGQSMTEVAQAAGVPLERIEPYALPVLAEREHVAALAGRSTVRRRGETSGHRPLKSALDERLSSRGIDTGAVNWDSSRSDDGRWTVSASYASGGSQHQAVFLFDLSSRFSVAGNDEARWVIGEQSPARGPQPGRRRPVRDEHVDDEPADESFEPTLDLSDELALVRAVQDEPEQPVAAVVEVAEVVQIEVIELGAEADEEVEPPSGAESGAAVEAEPVAESPAVPPTSELDTLYAMLDGYAEDSVRIYRGLDDTEYGGTTSPVAAWEPEIVVQDPGRSTGPDVGPDDPPSDDTSDEEEEVREGGVESTPELPDPPDPEISDQPDPAAIPDTTGDPFAPAQEEQGQSVPGEPEPKDPDAVLFGVPEPDGDSGVAKQAARKRKRASVPSWDEIMFGGPKRP